MGHAAFANIVATPPIKPKIRTEIKLAVVKHNNERDSIEKVKQIKTIRAGLPERSAM